MPDMPLISQITLPSGTTYQIKDAWARDQISALTGGSAVVFVGVSTTRLTDGGTQKPTIDGNQLTPTTGQLFFYGTQEFIYGTDGKWHALGSLDSLGALAYKDSASTTYKPAGTIDAPTFNGSSTTFSGKFTPSATVTVTTKATTNKTAAVNVAGSGDVTYTPEGTINVPIKVKTAGGTTKIKNPTSKTVATAVTVAAPGATAPSHPLTYYSVTDETLSLYQLGYNTEASITTNQVTVKTGDAAYQANEPTFTGTGVRLITGNIPVPNTYNVTYEGQQGDITVSGVPQGSVTAPLFNGTQVTITTS